MADTPRKLEYSIVTVTYTDGEVVDYPITAGHNIGRYLATDAGQCGVLTLFNKNSTVSIPLVNIRDWIILPCSKAKAEEMMRPKSMKDPTNDKS